MKTLKPSLSQEAKEKLLETLFYAPSTQFTSIKSLYDNVKNKGITYDEVREFINNQEATQLFKRTKRIKNYFPIVAKHKFEILQMDLVDMSNTSTANENYNYLLVAVDVFTRLGFVVPLKNKQSQSVVEAADEIFEIVDPKILNTDNGSEFIDSGFLKLLRKKNIEIRYAEVQDHHKLGIIDRFVRTLREKINKYLVMHKTTKYIDVLPKLISNYNQSYNSTIKKAPIEVEDRDINVIELTNKRYNKAKQEEIKYEVDDVVRYVINLKAFEKGTLPRWSKTLHKVVFKNEHSYILDNGKSYKYYELQLVKNSQELDKPIVEPTREQLMKQNRVKRRFRQTGLDTADIVSGKRERKVVDRLQLQF